MSWPPSSGYIKSGVIPVSVSWGTYGLLAPGSGPNISNAIVKSIRSSRIMEEIKVENGTGLTSDQVLLYQGDQVEITVVDDRSLTFPDVDGVVTLFNPIRAGNAPGSDGNPISTTQNFRVLNNDYNSARKQEGERVLLCKSYVLIDQSVSDGLGK